MMRKYKSWSYIQLTLFQSQKDSDILNHSAQKILIVL